MGRYSYTQPSSSDEVDFDYLLEEEAQLYKDEAESNLNNKEQLHYPPQPEVDEGIPRICYCGGEPVVATSYTKKDPGRRYYMCENVDDGDCHIWKWWDVAVTKEMSELQRQLRLLKEQGFECEQKMVKLQKQLSEINKTLSEVNKTVSEQKKLVSEVENTAYEQQKRLWEQNIMFIRVMVFILTVSIGMGLMFFIGRG